MNERLLTLSTPDGHTLNARAFEPEHPRAVLVISHGMAEHGDRYQALARWLVERDLAVITYHHRGHGPDCPEHVLGHYADQNGWQRVVDDLYQVLQSARRQYPDVPVNLLGHSMGSFIAQACTQQYPAATDTLILSATNRIHRPSLTASRLLVSLIAAMRGRRYRSLLIGKLTFGKFNRTFAPNRTSSDWLSRDPAQVDRYEADPLCGFHCSAGLWRDFIGGMLTIDPAHWRRDLPVHLLSGTHDAVGEMGRGVRQHFQAIRDAGVEPVTLRLFEGGRHELLNESNRMEVWQYLLGLCDIQPSAGITAGHATEASTVR
ncbi:MAG: alpha/beta hydrolase [Marinobacter sp. 34-60-7]|nr:MAG: alpha/beta hydrolase [Marinobacter sp. 34-60-7]